MFLFKSPPWLPITYGTKSKLFFALDTVTYAFSQPTSLHFLLALSCISALVGGFLHCPVCTCQKDPSCLMPPPSCILLTHPSTLPP